VSELAGAVELVQEQAQAAGTQVVHVVPSTVAMPTHATLSPRRAGSSRHEPMGHALRIGAVVTWG
jgi:hypothetical protein